MILIKILWKVGIIVCCDHIIVHSWSFPASHHVSDSGYIVILSYPASLHHLIFVIQDLQCLLKLVVLIMADLCFVYERCIQFHFHIRLNSCLVD